MTPECGVCDYGVPGPCTCPKPAPAPPERPKQYRGLCLQGFMDGPVEKVCMSGEGHPGGHQPYAMAAPAPPSREEKPGDLWVCSTCGRTDLKGPVHFGCPTFATVYGASGPAAPEEVK